MPPPGYEPFLAAICANPDDDTPRLVYADWLDENGDPDRAEFIRLHIERSRHREYVPYELLHEDRIGPLRAAHEAAWRSELPSLPDVTWGRMWRGFICEASVYRPDSLVRWQHDLFAAAPVQFLNLQKCTDREVAPLFGVDYLERLYGLRVVTSAAVPFWEALVSCPRLSGLHHLIVLPRGQEYAVRTPEIEEAFVSIAKSPHFPYLEKIHIEYMIGPMVEAELRARFRRVNEYDFDPL